MIVRDEGETYLLITQPDHARLSAHIVAAMRSEPALLGPNRDVVVIATSEHDNGWLEVDAQPTITPAGRPSDFIEGAAPIKHELWPRGIARAARAHPRAGALVAQHALTVYAYRRSEPEWLSFFLSVSALHDGLLREAGIASDEAVAEFEAEYRCVRLGDSFSLQFCNGWQQLQETLGYRCVLRGDSLLISPDPFAGTVVPLLVQGRRIPARIYASDADLREAWAVSAPVLITGHARGVNDVTAV